MGVDQTDAEALQTTSLNHQPHLLSCATRRTTFVQRTPCRVVAGFRRHGVPRLRMTALRGAHALLGMTVLGRSRTQKAKGVRGLDREFSALTSPREVRGRNSSLSRLVAHGDKGSFDFANGFAKRIHSLRSR